MKEKIIIQTISNHQNRFFFYCPRVPLEMKGLVVIV